MIIYNDDIDKNIRKLCGYYNYFFCNDNTNVLDLMNFYVSDDIKADYSIFDSLNNIKGNMYGGVAIPPFVEGAKTVILFSSDINNSPDIIAHEITHMLDFISFANRFCDGNLSKIRENVYFQTFIFWSEFHVKQVDIPFIHIILAIFQGKTEGLLDEFIAEISSFYYPEYTKKLLSKKGDFATRDIMWYFGEIAVCNKYDSNNKYTIDTRVKDMIGVNFQPVFNLLNKCLDFNSFSLHIEELHSLFNS